MLRTREASFLRLDPALLGLKMGNLGTHAPDHNSLFGIVDFSFRFCRRV